MANKILTEIKNSAAPIGVLLGASCGGFFWFSYFNSISPWLNWVLMGASVVGLLLFVLARVLGKKSRRSNQKRVTMLQVLITSFGFLTLLFIIKNWFPFIEIKIVTMVLIGLCLLISIFMKKAWHYLALLGSFVCIVFFLERKQTVQTQVNSASTADRENKKEGTKPVKKDQNDELKKQLADLENLTAIKEKARKEDSLRRVDSANTSCRLITKISALQSRISQLEKPIYITVSNCEENSGGNRQKAIDDGKPPRAAKKYIPRRNYSRGLYCDSGNKKSRPKQRAYSNGLNLPGNATN